MRVKIIKKIILLLLLIFFANDVKSTAHPFYVSICQIDYNAQNRSLEISVKIFADDLFYAFKEKEIGDLYIGEEKENPKTNEYIFNYMKDNISIKIDNTPVDFIFVGKETENAYVWSFLEVQNVNPFQKIQVTDRVLTEIYESQNNVVQVKNKGKILNLLLLKDDPSGELIF